jgi:hypothetical protein
MKFLRVVAVLPLALAACGGKARPVQPTVSSQECAAAGQNTARLLTASVADVSEQFVADLGATLERQCVQQVWSEDAQACTATATDDIAMQACDPLLTDAQKEAIAREKAGIEMATSGGGTTYGATQGSASGPPQND